VKFVDFARILCLPDGEMVGYETRLTFPIGNRQLFKSQVQTLALVLLPCAVIAA
jgi:hypothetical protein